MNETMNLETEIKIRWDLKNTEGNILYKLETLKTRELNYEDFTIHLIHNSCRDVYDKISKNISHHKNEDCPFCGNSELELKKTSDQFFRILGNRFACIQYQSILVPVVHQEVITQDFLKVSLEFSKNHPQLTLMYNAAQAGRTVSHLYWIISFQEYKILTQPGIKHFSLCEINGTLIQTRKIPTYMIEFDLKDITSTADLLYTIISHLSHKNFNMFLHLNRVYFIPRENIEVPNGFHDHRFGGLEMIGYFIMKSEEEFKSMDTKKVIRGMEQIALRAENQERLEKYLISLSKNG
jgi:hypothetical protein